MNEPNRLVERLCLYLFIYFIYFIYSNEPRATRAIARNNNVSLKRT
jgi:hypothetical protein